MKKILASIIALVLFCTSFVVCADTSSDFNCSDWAIDGINGALSAGYVPRSIQLDYTLPITRGEFVHKAGTYYFDTNLEQKKTTLSNFVPKL